MNQLFMNTRSEDREMKVSDRKGYVSCCLRSFFALMMMLFMIVPVETFAQDPSLAPQPIVPAGSPCTAHRWFSGDGWRQNTADNTVPNKWEATVQASPNLQPKGIVRCASSAEAESQLQDFKGTYDPTDYLVLGGSNGYNMETETFDATVASPVAGQDIIWLNFDIRPLAGTYQFQIVTNPGQIGWAIYQVPSALAQPTTATGTIYPPGPSGTPSGLSGDCSTLEKGTIIGAPNPAINYGLTGNGWTTISVNDDPTKPTNYYVAIWMIGGTEFPSSLSIVYKSRYGCGGSTCLLVPQDTTTTCVPGGYQLCGDFFGNAGQWNVVDNATTKATSYSVKVFDQNHVQVGPTLTSSDLTTNPLQVTLGIIPDGAVFATVCATYADGVAGNISLVPDPNYSTGNDYRTCTDASGFSGTFTAPECSTFAGATGAGVTENAGPLPPGCKHAYTFVPAGIGATAQITPTSGIVYEPVIGPPGAYTYNTSTGVLTITGVFNGQLSFPVYRLLEGSCICRDTVCLDVQVVCPGPFVISGPETVCANGSGFVYTYPELLDVSSFIYQWSVTGGATIQGSSVDVASVTVNPDGSGNPYTVTLIVSNRGFNFECGRDDIIVAVDPTPTCSIDGPAAVCGGSTNQHTSTVLPAGGTVTHSWTISGDGVIDGSTTGATVTVIAGASGSYTITDNITRNGCPSSCQKTVTVNPNPTCSIDGPAAVCGGSTNQHTSTVLPAGGTVTHSWTISGDGVIDGSTTGATVTVIAAASGSYTVTDNITRNGCPSSCQKTVTVNPNPTCSIDGPAAVCGGSTNQHTSTVLPAGGTVTHSWTISGDGVIDGSTTGATVTVIAGASGSYTVTDNITRNGCPSSCQKTVTVNANPTCSIDGPAAVCGGSTNQHTSTVLPAGGTVTHSWTISGDGVIDGSTTGATVTVIAGASGSYTITDNITRNGCPSSCQKTVTVNPNPTCSIDGPAAVCGGSTNQHTSTVLPAGGTVTHSWTISGDGVIDGSTTGATVTVIAGASGSYTITDNITRNGCPSSCQKTVTVNPNPTCSIDGPGEVCGLSTNQHTSTVLPAGGTVTHSWTISGDGVIDGSTTGATVTVIAGASGSYTITDNITRNGCPSSCQKTVIINGQATCSIDGPAAVCGGSTNQHTSTVLPAGGTVTHSWTISGDGVIDGSTTGATVTVIAGASGSYTITDNITRNGCPSSCQITVTVNPNPTCSIDGPAAVCGGSTNQHTSTVLPAGGTVTHSWTISGDGVIDGSTTGATVTVIAGASGSYTVTDNITRNGCPSSCQKTVTVNPNPTCSIDGPAAVCGGSTNQHTSTVLPAGGTVTHSWTISGDGVIDGSTTGATVTVIAGASGSYTITDNITRNGCASSCQKTVTVNPNPTCSIDGPAAVCGGSTNQHTSTVLPAGGTVTHSWSIVGDGVIDGSTTGATVTVIAGASGSYTITDNITRNGCPSSCQKTVTVNPNPTCSIDGPAAVCGGSTNQHTSSVLPAGGTVTHSWTISGDGVIDGSTTGATVTVIAGASGSYTITDNITRNGCPSSCQKTVVVNGQASCTIDGPAAVCGGSTNQHTSTVLPAGGTVTHSWTISGDGVIDGSTTGATVTVIAGASGSYTVTDNITRNGCASSCQKTVTVNPNPTCSIDGPAAVCGGSTNQHTSTVLPAGGTVTHSWTISGDGVIDGSTTGATVTVIAGASGSYTITDNITRNGCASSCQKTVTVNPNPTCSIDGPAAVCGGSTNQHTSTVLPAGGTVTHSWSIVGDGVIDGSTTGATVTVIAGASGSYTVTDNITRNGCASSCQKTVTVNPNPTCSIDGPAAVCGGSTNQHTSTVLPAGGTVTHSWSIVGDGVIDGSTTGATVTVIAGASGSYTITDNITRNGCASSCQKTVTVNANPTCSIDGPAAVCGGSTNQHTSTVLPAGGTVTHSWTISGDGVIDGSTTGATVTVIAGASGSYTITDNITRNGCPSSCQKTVTVNPNPTCSIDGPSTLCYSNVSCLAIECAQIYTSTVLPAGGTVTHSWSIVGNAIILGSTTGSSVYVALTGAGGFTLTDNITRNGCPSSCQKTVTVNPNPTCSIDGPEAVCGGSTNQHTSTVLPAGGTVTHSWTISGDGVIDGSNTGATVTVIAGASGSYTVTDNITRNGCPSSCQKTVTVNPNPTCNITGPDNICSASVDNIYTSTVLPAGGTVTHSWTISGNGTIVGATDGASVNVTAGAAGSFTLTDNITRNGCVSSCSITITVIGCGNFCSYTQGYYGNKNGRSCDGENTYRGGEALIRSLLGVGTANPRPLTVGSGSRTVTIPATADGARNLNKAMPGGGNPTRLPNGNCTIPANGNGCWSQYLTARGRIGNNLLSQTIVLSLNSRMNEDALAAFQLQDGWLVTGDREGCGDDAVNVSCADGGSLQSFKMNSTVINYLTGVLGHAPDVQDLLDLANALLGGTLNPGQNVGGYYVPSYGDVNNQVDLLNNAFDECRAFIGYFDCAKTCETINEPCSVGGIAVMTTATTMSGKAAPAVANAPVKASVTVFPNPFSDKVNFMIDSPFEGTASLKVFNSMGQHISTLFQGTVSAGKSRIIRYNVPATAKGNLFYVYEQNGQKFTGTLIRL